LTSTRIEQRANFSFIRYGNVWEDADVLCRALGPGSKGQRLLSIASAGDNVLALLTLDPKEVVAADLNPAQLACLELRIAAFQSLTYEGVLAFLGVDESAQRLQTYQSLRRRLSQPAQVFWDSHPQLIERGIIHAGKLEGFLRRYQKFLQRWVHSSASIQQLLTPRNQAGRVAYYEGSWNTWGWRLLNRVAFSRQVMGSQGRDPEFFRHADGDVTSGPSRRLEKALTLKPTQDNPYLTYHLTGNYSRRALPLYLRREHFNAIRRRSHRVRNFLGPVEKAPGRFHGFNLSNIFEYMDEAQHSSTYNALARKGLSGGRLAYWNLHVRRPLPDSAKQRAVVLHKMSRQLHARDKNWAYRSFNVDQIRP
jgi:S-adenosylmethionine-diacylglycerol 3-amino-3-carboxypropyl transferase